MPSKTLPAKAASAAVLAVLSLGGVAAAATGLLPGPAKPAAERASAGAAVGRAVQAQGAAAAKGAGRSGALATTDDPPPASAPERPVHGRGR